MAKRKNGKSLPPLPPFLSYPYRPLFCEEWREEEGDGRYHYVRFSAVGTRLHLVFQKAISKEGEEEKERRGGLLPLPPRQLPMKIANLFFHSVKQFFRCSLLMPPYKFTLIS